MLPEIFLLGLAAALAALFFWGFRTLPGEGWQVIGCVLAGKERNGSWHGLNLTYYGFFNATAYVIAAVLFFILMGSLFVPVAATLAILAAILGICMPASGLIAFWVEGKANTFTVGGASFAGLIAAPWIVQLINWTVGNRMGFSAPVWGRSGGHLHRLCHRRGNREAGLHQLRLLLWEAPGGVPPPGQACLSGAGLHLYRRDQEDRLCPSS